MNYVIVFITVSWHLEATPSSSWLPVDSQAEFKDADGHIGFVTAASRRHLSAYDASYLELAPRTKLPLATLDADLQRAVTKAGAQLLKTIWVPKYTVIDAPVPYTATETHPLQLFPHVRLATSECKQWENQWPV